MSLGELVKHALEMSGWDETGAIVRLYNQFFERAIKEGLVSAFVGPGDGNEVIAMTTICRERGIPFEAVQVDRPDSVCGPVPGIPELVVDYTIEIQKVIDFFMSHGVNAVIVRNPPVDRDYVEPLIKMAEYVVSKQGAMLLTLRETDFSRSLEERLINLGAEKFTKPRSLNATEKYIYVI